MPSSFLRFSRSQNDATQSVGLPWTSDQLIAKTSTWQYNNHINAPGEIRTHDLSRRAAVDPRLRPRDYWDRPSLPCLFFFFCSLPIDLKIRFAIYTLWVITVLLGNGLQWRSFVCADRHTGLLKYVSCVMIILLRHHCWWRGGWGYQRGQVRFYRWICGVFVKI